MKTITMITVAGSLAFAAAPALAAPTAPNTPTASQQCKSEQTGMGKQTFIDTFGTKANAFGKCVSSRSSKTAAAAKVAKTNASKVCKAEEALNPAAFADKYGTGKKNANAHGKCVSSLAKAKTTATVKAQVKDDINAAKTCKAARKATPGAFKAKNAFGKCVAKAAKAAAEARQA